MAGFTELKHTHERIVVTKTRHAEFVLWSVTGAGTCKSPKPVLILCLKTLPRPTKRGGHSYCAGILLNLPEHLWENGWRWRRTLETSGTCLLGVSQPSGTILFRPGKESLMFTPQGRTLGACPSSNNSRNPVPGNVTWEEASELPSKVTCFLCSNIYIYIYVLKGDMLSELSISQKLYLAYRYCFGLVNLRLF